MDLAEQINSFPLTELANAVQQNSPTAFEGALRGYTGTANGTLFNERTGCPATGTDILLSRRGIEISVAQTRAELTLVEGLVREKYLARGYQYNGRSSLHEFPAKQRRGFQIVAQSDGQVLGTVTLGIDSSGGLHVDDGNREHIDAVRGPGRRIGEVVKLAVVEACDSKRVLAALFGAAHALMVLFTLTDVFIEVNPRHVAFYRRALCFVVAGVEKICPRVGAPSILLRLNVPDLTSKIAMLEHALALSPRYLVA